MRCVRARTCGTRWKNAKDASADRQDNEFEAELHSEQSLALQTAFNNTIRNAGIVDNYTWIAAVPILRKAAFRDPLALAAEKGSITALLRPGFRIAAPTHDSRVPRARPDNR